MLVVNRNSRSISTIDWRTSPAPQLARRAAGQAGQPRHDGGELVTLGAVELVGHRHQQAVRRDDQGVLDPGHALHEVAEQPAEVGSLGAERWSRRSNHRSRVASQSEVVSVGVAAADGVPEVALSPRSASCGSALDALRPRSTPARNPESMPRTSTASRERDGTSGSASTGASTARRWRRIRPACASGAGAELWLNAGS